MSPTLDQLEAYFRVTQWIFGEHYISLILGVPNFPNFSIFPFQNQIISPNMMENELFYQIWGNGPPKAAQIKFFLLKKAGYLKYNF